MMFSSLSLAAFAAALVAPSAVNAHGYVHDLVVGGKNYSGWLPFTDPCVFLPCALREPQDDRLKTMTRFLQVRGSGSQAYRQEDP